ncbi:lytic transglycosylase [Candidatus Enterovibrio escicola]|uniref:Membrane-bound lytic murein transglycosylase D n=1 Tax=Candidatus Enterovibrio escicola TaxID=1927127 RepID=A0A2A5T0R8_9GAMM|nr:LysM peptidoglycan-binding domain-containing protein [Candidatus Enterovibrio escacola]PCS21720.1 Membrane-bound lytic murein transglycosylase D precursor [Candidatus Enterovibrio escacola]
MKLRYVLTCSILLIGCQLSKTNNIETIRMIPEKTTTNQQIETNSIVVKEDPIPHAVTPQAQENIWDRITMQLELAVPDKQRINYYRNWYLKHPQHLETVAKRAEPFLYLITEKVEARGIPLEIALLPIVESAFDQFAYSHEQAAGLWQFVPDTGHRFGLKQNWWYDGRRDVIASTDAALDLLEYLHKKFNGNWFHALAAYNTGERRIFMAIRKNKSMGKPTDFWSLDLPKETSEYVPKLIAVADIIKHQHKYKLSLLPIVNKPVVGTVDPNVQMDLAQAANYAGLSLSELKSLNPGYNHWVTSPNGPTHFLLPHNKIDRFKRTFSDNGNKSINITRYKVKTGDSLSLIAQRHHTTIKVIKLANSLDSSNILSGQHLIIPNGLKVQTKYSLNDLRRFAKFSSKKNSDYKLSYRVKQGDSFWKISLEQDISYKDLARWNGMNLQDPLHIGQKLTMWKRADDNVLIRTILYSIREGDSLSSIALQYNVSVSELVKWNSLKKHEYLKLRQKLKIYIDISETNSKTR